LRSRLRREVPHLDDDRYLHIDIAAATRMARDGAVAEAVQAVTMPSLEAEGR
jgi:histidine ammonia-lyase